MMTSLEQRRLAVAAALRAVMAEPLPRVVPVAPPAPTPASPPAPSVTPPLSLVLPRPEPLPVTYPFPTVVPEPQFVAVAVAVEPAEPEEAVAAAETVEPQTVDLTDDSPFVYGPSHLDEPPAMAPPATGRTSLADQVKWDEDEDLEGAGKPTVPPLENVSMSRVASMALFGN